MITRTPIIITTIFILAASSISADCNYPKKNFVVPAGSNSTEAEMVEVKDEAGNAIETFLSLRQQSKKSEGKPNIALADFIAPKDSGKEDYMGCFCVSTGFGTQELAEQFEKENDDSVDVLLKM